MRIELCKKRIGMVSFNYPVGNRKDSHKKKYMLISGYFWFTILP